MPQTAIKEYFGDLNGGSLLLTDSHIIARLMQADLTNAQWQSQLADENILQRRSVHTAKRIAKTVRQRLSHFSGSYHSAVAQAQGQEYAQLLMAALMKDSPVVADFMRRYVQETLRIYKTHLSKAMWWEHVELTARRFEDQMPYSEQTLEKMGKNLFRALAEADYIDSARRKQLQRVYLAPSVRFLLQGEGEQKMIEMMETHL